MIYRFGESDDFELDEALFQLRRRGKVIPLSPRIFDVLRFLIRNRDHVVSKDELLDGVWAGEAVSESVLPSNVTALRKALGDERAGARMIQTVHGRGYRFVAAVEERESASSASNELALPGAAGAVQPASGATPFVGRAEVMAELRADLERAFAGSGGLVFLVGEPGIGKTRTADELAAEASGRGARVLQGRCYEGEGAPAYWPWVQILRTALRGAEPGLLREQLGAGATDIAQLVPELRGLFPELPDPPDLQSEHARFRLFDSVASFMGKASRSRPLVLVLDDLHWADAPTLLLLQFLARELREVRVLLLGAYRDVEVRRHHPLAQVSGELAREPHFHRILLRGLSRGDVASFVEGVTGTGTPEEVLREVYELSEGNPFFLHETVRLFASEGRLADDGGPGDWGLAIPQGVRDVIGRRLDTLSPDCNRVLGLAAVIGREFGLSVLQPVAELPAEMLLQLIDEAEAAGIVDAVGAGGETAALGRFSFTHTLIRETLYGEQSAPERARHHRRVGEALEAVYGAEAEDHLPELAHHFFQAVPAGDLDRAVDYAERAAAAALELLAFEESIGHYQRALQALEFRLPVDEVRRCELGLALGGALYRAGRYAEQRRTVLRAADTARKIDRPDLLARAAMTLSGWPPDSGPGVTEEVAQFRALAEEALEQIGDSERALRARLLSGLAVTPPDQDSMQRRDLLSQQALDLSRQTGDTEALFDALFARQWALLGPDDAQRRMEVATEILHLGERLGAKERIFTGHEDRTRALLALGDIESADRELDACQRLAEELRLPIYWYSIVRFQLARAFGDGRLDDAESLIARFAELGASAGGDGWRVLTVLWNTWLMHERGRLAEVKSSFESLLGEQAWLGVLGHAALAKLQVELANLDVARQHFELVAKQSFADIPRDESWMFILFLAAETCAELADERRAASLYALLEPYANCNISHQTARFYVGAAASSLGRLAILCAGRAEALRHFETALVLGRRMGTRPALVRTQYQLARLLLNRAPGCNRTAAVAQSDRDRARSLLSEARKMAESTGMAGMLESIGRLD
jgi:DNA-binding winged helix-turn-helix (wHTH) protein/tetratricopeptide (TPR) repeat protein